MLFGSNWPMIAPARCLEKLDTLGLSDEQRAGFLWRNAARVFKLPGFDGGSPLLTTTG